jgi:hypothetical protein
MKLSTTLPVLSLMLFIGAGANAACVYPQAPQTIPNGGKATKEEMLATQSEIKAYRAAVEETYLPCLEQEKSESLAALDSADPELAQKKATIESMHAKKHNAALEELQAIAGRWSEELKAFSAAAKK